MNMTRRTFLKGTAALGTALALGKSHQIIANNLAGEIPAYISGSPAADALDTSPDVQIIYSVCLQCHSDCTIRGKVKDGILLKLDGSPYSPMTYTDPLPYDTDPKEAAKHRGRMCARGQAGIQTAYDPYRVKQPLKRVGPRGSGKWQAISWEQAYDEIVEGGNLFGEGSIDGLRKIRDLKTLIDPNVPELGSKANQFVFYAGRIEHGRSEFSKRFINDAYGSINWFEHTSICEQSHHIATGLTAKGKEHFKPDIVNCHYLLLFGSSLVEANFPMNGLAYRVGQFKENGGKLVVVDPRMSITAGKAERWLPVKPGGDGALAMGLVRWIIENERYDKRYLQNTTKEAAEKDHEPTWSDATYLVRLDTRKFLRADEAGLLNGTKDDYVVAVNGQPTVYNAVEHGDLEGTFTINGISCKTVFALLKESAMRNTLAEYAKISGIAEKDIEKTAEEFTSYGKAAVADFYRGPVKHTNGVYQAQAILALNLLIGNVDWKGGYGVGAGHIHEMGDHEGARYDLKKLHPNNVKPEGLKISREGKKYEESAEFKKNGYPAKRPWFPFTKNVWQEVLSGIADDYPYPIKVFFLHMGAPTYSIPGMKDIIINLLKDIKKVPLFFACDIVIGETSMYADYILPDVSYLEQWGTPHAPPTIVTNVSMVRQPMVKVYPNTKSLEEILIAIAKKMDLPGFGDNGFGSGMPLNTPEDWYLKMVANYGHEGEVPGSSEEEQMNYVLARGGVFEAANKAYAGPHLNHKYGNILNFYFENVASSRDSITGEYYSGIASLQPILDHKGNSIDDEGYPFHLISYKLPFHTQSRTITSPWLVEIMPENFVEINAEDAKKLGIKNGDKVRIVSATNQKGEVGKARLMQGLRPGVVAVSHHFGHWAAGGVSAAIDGKETGADSGRLAGISATPVMRLDTSVGNVCLQDPIGGSVATFDTKIKILKV